MDVQSTFSRTRSHRALAFLLACVLAPVARAQDWSAWKHSLDLVLDTSPSGAGVSGDVEDFPVLVRLEELDFDFSQAKRGGEDIRFTAPDGTALSHQVDLWNPAGGKAAFWVKVPRLLGGTADQHIVLRWGNPSAAAPDGWGVFTLAAGDVGVWHLGGSGDRPNAVAGNPAAKPIFFDGDESRPGHIGVCDSLGGDPSGDHFTLGEGYADFTSGLTFSAWVHPTAVRRFARLLDLGNGENMQNIVITREGTTDGLRFASLQPGGMESHVFPGVFVLNRWQHIAVTVGEEGLRVYRDGRLLGSAPPLSPLFKAKRVWNFIGKSSWSADGLFEGKLDEVRLGRKTRGQDWIKLSYENQKAGQTLVRARRQPVCATRFTGGADLDVDEGSAFALRGTADCAMSRSWSVLSGPSPLILDPLALDLHLAAPRVEGDTQIVYEFKADFPDGPRVDTVAVRVRDNIPEPDFLLPYQVAWTDAESLLVQAEILNLPKLTGPGVPALRFAWTLSSEDPGADPDTAWAADALVVRKPAGSPTLQVTLCLDNGGRPRCRTTRVEKGTVALRHRVRSPRTAVPGFGPGRVDALGRSRAAARVPAAAAAP